MQAQQMVVGVDLGGTNITAVLLSDAMQRLAVASESTDADRGVEQVISKIKNAISEVCQQASIQISELTAIGIGTPGPMDPKRGLVLNAPNLEGWHNVPLVQELGLSVPVSLVNDANAAAIAEFHLGAGASARTMCMLTLGTGIGGAIVLNGKVWTGQDMNAGELGHMIVFPGGRRCSCGQHGCLEAYAGCAAMLRAYHESSDASCTESSSVNNGLSLLRAVNLGDQSATEVWEQACLGLALAIINVNRMISPDLTVLGGGLAGAGQQLLDRVRERTVANHWTLTERPPAVALAELGGEAGAIGAAFHAFAEHRA